MEAFQASIPLLGIRKGTVSKCNLSEGPNFICIRFQIPRAARDEISSPGLPGRRPRGRPRKRGAISKNTINASGLPLSQVESVSGQTSKQRLLRSKKGTLDEDEEGNAVHYPAVQAGEVISSGDGLGGASGNAKHRRRGRPPKGIEGQAKVSNGNEVAGVSDTVVGRGMARVQGISTSKQLLSQRSSLTPKKAGPKPSSDSFKQEAFAAVSLRNDKKGHAMNEQALFQVVEDGSPGERHDTGEEMEMPTRDEKKPRSNRIKTRGSVFKRGPTPGQEVATRMAEVRRIAKEGENAPDSPVVYMGSGSDPIVSARSADESTNAVVRRPEEELVLRETAFRDGRYGACFNCGGRVVIPGLVQFYCENCCWIRRPIEARTIAPGHHD